MGFCIADGDQYDAFLSYARADNELHIGWIADFEEYLRRMVVAQLKCAPESTSDAERFSICRDEHGFPQSGGLVEAIEEKVKSSQWLFIFLGKGYLRSEYCLYELEVFRNRCGGSIEDALKRLYVIVLESEALRQVMEGLPEERSRLWKPLRDLTARGIRKEDFLHGGNLIPIHVDREHFDHQFHERCKPLVEEFARKLIECRRKATFEIQQTDVRREIVVGAVPPRLRGVRNELVKALGALRKPISVTVIDEKDLRHPTEEVKERLRCATVLVQPFDNLEVIARRGDPVGGHLALQKSLFETCSELPSDRKQVIWWEPDCRVPPGPDDGPIDEQDRDFLARQPADSKRHLAPKALATELIQPESSTVTARIWVEWEEADQQKIHKAQEIVTAFFERTWEEKMAQKRLNIRPVLKFGEADWESLEEELTQKPDGVILVYNDRKDDRAFRRQWQTIDDLPDVLHHKLFPGLFNLRVNRVIIPSQFWGVVRFTVHDHDLTYDEDQITEFVRKLVYILYERHFERERLDGSSE